MSRLALLLFIIPVILLILHFETAEPGSPDGGLLILAGTSSLLDEGRYEIVQRPPFYSVVLAGIAVLTGVNPDEGDTSAVELGNIQPFFVAADLLETPFLRAVVIFHAGLWALSLWLMMMILRRWKVSRWGIGFALGVLALPSAWMMVGQVYDTVLCQFLVMVAMYFTPIPSLFPHNGGRGSFSDEESLVPPQIAGEAKPFSALQGASLLAAGCFSIWRRLGMNYHAPTDHADLRTRQCRVPTFVVIGICLALMGITRATFQLLSPALLVVIVPLILYRYRRGIAVRVMLALLIPWMIFVGGWSLHNLTQHGVLGVSGVTGVALSTKTALYMEDTSGFPNETPDFMRLRDETFLTSSQRGDVIFWGARAANWLMAERNLTYDEANRLLTRYNISVIIRNPLSYLAEVVNSVVNFHFPVVNPAWSGWVKIAVMGLELLLLAGFLLLSALWAALHVLRWTTGFIKAEKWLPVDTLILLLLAVFYYTAWVSSAADVGKPDHRLAVQMVIPVIILLIVQRLKRGDDVSSPAAASDSGPDHPKISSSTTSSAL